MRMDSIFFLIDSQCSREHFGYLFLSVFGLEEKNVKEMQLSSVVSGE